MSMLFEYVVGSSLAIMAFLKLYEFVEFQILLRTEDDD